jgi:hypothetical protein
MSTPTKLRTGVSELTNLESVLKLRGALRRGILALGEAELAEYPRSGL